MFHPNVSTGKGAGELNLIILIPKTEARAQGGEVCFVSIYSMITAYENHLHFGISRISWNDIHVLLYLKQVFEDEEYL